jgi:hypothetical protein
MTALAATFSGFEHRPSEEMWTALGAVAHTLEGMADRTAQPMIYLSSLDPGVGKTATYVHFLRELIASPDHDHVGALVCISRREQIAAVVEAAGLRREDFAVFTSDADMNSMGRPDANEARVLFTTHRMVEVRCRNGSFERAAAFHYRNKPRAVRIWDEAILPGQTLTVERYALALLLKPLQNHRPELAADVERLFDAVGRAQSGEVIQIEDLAEKHGVTLNEALAIVQDGSADQRAAVEALWFLFGKPVSVRRDGTRGNTMLDYRDTLPEDIKPLLALDASVRVRSVYSYWEDHRGGVVRLPEAAKRYDQLTIHVWKRGGGRTSLRKADARLAEALANTISTKPAEPWLVIHHKDRGGESLENDVRSLLPDDGIRVHFLHWGAHDATNRFADVPNVILAGTLFFPPSYYEALGRLATGRHPGDGPISDEDLSEIMLGEHRHLILQALCRGAVRRCDGAGCPPTHAYIIASGHSGIAKALPGIFPGAHVVQWKPLKTELVGKAGDAARFILARLDENPDGIVRFGDVMAHLGWKDRRDFKRSIRRHIGFRDALDEAGVEEWGPGKHPIGFRRTVAV